MNLLLLLLLLPASVATADPAHGPPRGEDACGSGEKWNLSPEHVIALAPGNFRQPVVSFAQGLALRRAARTEPDRMLGEYWVARSLHTAGLIHLAQGGMAAIATRATPTPTTIGIALMSLECLVRMHESGKLSGLPPALNAELLHRYKNLVPSGRGREVVLRAALLTLSENLDTRSLRRTLELLEDPVAPAYARLGQGWAAAAAKDYEEQIAALGAFLKDARPRALERHSGTARALLARAHYALGQYEPAAREFRAIEKSSNDLAENLSSLAWAQLMDDRYEQAIGAAMSLQAGGLRRTFAPEAPMVMAMALNELCQYPKALQAIQLFRKQYASAHAWLQTHEGARQPLYPLAISYLKGNETAPDRVATEWLRSPLFIAHQAEANLTFDEKEAATALARSAKAEQRKMAREILLLARDLKPRIRKARLHLQAGEELSTALRAALTELKDKVTVFNRVRQAAPIWRAILARAEDRMTTRRRELVAAINRDLAERNERMIAQLAEVSENVQLIEVEIFNGASQDIVWRNAHPDYAAAVDRLRSDAAGNADARVWKWGRAPASTPNEIDGEGRGEVWEDELGSFEANLTDHCDSKDRYLALKRSENR